MTDHEEPTTEAGRRLVTGEATRQLFHAIDGRRDRLIEQVLAIEAEARATAPVVCLGGCGSLDWTLREYGVITHKHSCPRRTTTFCQSHRDGCPEARATAPSGLREALRSAAEEAHIFGPDHDRRPIFECSYEPCRQRRAALAADSEHAPQVVQTIDPRSENE